MGFKLLGTEECPRCRIDWRNKEVLLRESNPFDPPSPRCVCGCFIKTYSVKSCNMCNDTQIVEMIAGPDGASLEEAACPMCVGG